MHKLFYITILFLSFTINILANNNTQNSDSLLNIWNDTNLSDSLRLDAYQNYNHFSILYSTPDIAVKNANEIITYAKANNQPRFVALAMNSISIAHRLKGESQKAIDLLYQIIPIWEELGNKRGIAVTYGNISLNYSFLGKLDEALEMVDNVYEIFKSENDINSQAIALQNKHSLLTKKGDFLSALDVIYKSLELHRSLGNKSSEADCLTNISIVYSLIGENEMALEKMYEVIPLRKEIGEKKRLANAYFNLANMSNIQDSTSKYLFLSLEIYDEIENQIGQASVKRSIASLLVEKKDFDNAKRYIDEAYKVLKDMDDLVELTKCYENYGAYYKEIGQLKKSKEMYSKALKNYEDNGYFTSEKVPARNLYLINKSLGDYQNALYMLEKYNEINDSIVSEENKKESLRKSFEYNYKLKTVEDSIKGVEEKKVIEAQIFAKDEQIAREQTQRFALYGGVLLLLIFGGTMYNRYKVTQEQKLIIEDQKIAVENEKTEAEKQRDLATKNEAEANKQKHLVEEKNKEILDSINYAKRIQTAILPPPKVVKSFLDDSFILYLPKDIVAGDFYWMESLEISNPSPVIANDTTSPVIAIDEGEKQSPYHSTRKILFAAADCTGHGVPGAMVSVICNNGLNRSVREYGITEPGKILDKTREIVIEEFQKSEEEVKDGMDIALCCLETFNDGCLLQYAGANNPLWVLRKGSLELEEIKADKQPIGKYADNNPFTTHNVKLEKGDSIYIFTDGFQDQFGGEKGKKFKPANLRKLILSIQNLTMPEQREAMLQAFDQWKGDLEQIDDVCIIGVRL